MISSSRDTSKTAKTPKTPKTSATGRRASLGATAAPLTLVHATVQGKESAGRIAGPKNKKKTAHKPTLGLGGRMAPPSGTPAPASLSTRHLKADRWNWLREQLLPIVGPGAAHLEVKEGGIKAAQALELQGDALRIWSETIRTLALNGEADAARRLLGMCGAPTRLAVFEALLPATRREADCLLAMANNETPIEQRQFINLLSGPLQQAIDEQRIDLAFSLVSYLPPAKQARWFLRLETAQAAPVPVPVPFVPASAHQPLTLARGDIDDDTWFLVEMALQEAVGEQNRRQNTGTPPPVLEITHEKISTPRPQMASWTHTAGFSQAIGVLLAQQRFAQACGLLLMCSPLAQAYVFQALMKLQGQAGTCFDQLANAAQPEVRALFAQAVAGCLEGVAGFSKEDKARLDATLKQLSDAQNELAEQQRQKPQSAPASREMRFWRAYAACSTKVRQDLDLLVPSPWLELKQEALDLSARTAALQGEIAAAFGRSADAGLEVCERAMQAGDQWKADRQWGLLVRGIVAEALRQQESRAGWTPEQDKRVASLNELLWIGSLTSRDMKGLSAWPEACDMVLRAAVEQAINADSPGDHLRGLVALCQALGQGHNALERHLGCRLNGYLRDALDKLQELSVDNKSRTDLETQLQALPPLIGDPFLAAGDVTELVQMGQEAAALEYLDVLDRTLEQQCRDQGLKWELGGWTATANGETQGMRQRQVAEQARLVWELCAIAHQRPQLAALKEWLANKALPLAACDEATQRAIGASTEQAWMANAVRRVWSEACGTRAQTQVWMRELFRLRLPLASEERQAILERLDSKAFAQWLGVVQNSGGRQRAALEEVLAQLLGSEHLDAGTIDWMARTLGHPIDPQAEGVIRPASLLDGAWACLIMSPEGTAATCNRVIKALGPRIDLLSALTSPFTLWGQKTPSGIDRLLRLCDTLSEDPTALAALSSLPGWPDAWKVALGLGEIRAERRRQGAAFDIDGKTISAVAGLPPLDNEVWRVWERLMKPLWRHAVANGLHCPASFNVLCLDRGYFNGHGSVLSLWEPNSLPSWMAHVRALPLSAGASTAEQEGAMRCRLMLTWLGGWRSMMAEEGQWWVDLRVLQAMKNESPQEQQALATAMVAAFELLTRTSGDMGHVNLPLQELASVCQQAVNVNHGWLDSLPPDSRTWVQALIDTTTMSDNTTARTARGDLHRRLREQWPPLAPDSKAWRDRFEQYARSAATGT